MIRLSDGEEIMTLVFFVLIQYRSVTDRQMDRRMDIPPLAMPAVCIARYANALVKSELRSINYKELHVSLDPLTWNILGDYILALRGCCTLKFLHMLEIDQGLLAHTPRGTGPAPPQKKL